MTAEEIYNKRIESAASNYDEWYVDDSKAWIAYESYRNGAKFILDKLWISVEDELPKKDGVYYVITDGTQNEVYDMAKYEDKVWHKASKITHWMPIPKGVDDSKQQENYKQQEFYYQELYARHEQEMQEMFENGEQ